MTSRLEAAPLRLPRPRPHTGNSHGPHHGHGPGPGHGLPLGAVRTPVDLEVLIPAFNEASRLPATLAAMVRFLSHQPWSSRIVVVDGSYDDTAAIVQTLNLGLQHDSEVEVVAIGCTDPGKGAAVLRGLRTSSARFVGFTDADLATPLATMVHAVAALEAGAAAAIASRHAPGSRFAVRQPLGRRIGGHVFRTLARPLVPGVRDTQCGFKFFDRVAVMAAFARCRSTGFAFDVELLRQVHDLGGRRGAGPHAALGRVPRLGAPPGGRAGGAAGRSHRRHERPSRRHR
jgi:dolichyl-phosphate beta-glucosyltransferase